MCHTRSCTTSVLETRTDKQRSCLDRIRWLQDSLHGGHLPERDACARVAKEFPEECGRCTPSTDQNCAVPPPAVLFSDGCSHSTAIMELILELLRLDGQRIVAPVYEPQICAQNSFCRLNAQQPTLGSAVVQALYAEVRWAATRCNSVLLKAHCRGVAWADYSRALQRLGAAGAGLSSRVVALYRPNVLDVLICEVRDCMSRRDGFPVLRRTSTGDSVLAAAGRVRVPRPVNCSIERRRLPQRQQPMVWLDPARLVARLQEKLHTASHFCLRQTWPRSLLGRFSTELLLQFEREVDPSSHGFNRSAQAWARLLDGLGARPDESRLRGYLEARPKRPHSEAVPLPHADIIFNAEEVQAALREAGVRSGGAGAAALYSSLWRK